MDHKKAEKTMTWIISGALLFIIVSMAFAIGVMVGQERAKFSFRWAENYHRVFGGPKEGFLSNFPNKDFVNGHGIFGTVLSVAGNEIAVKDRDGAEKMLIVSSKTTITCPQGSTDISGLMVGDSIIAIGSPDEQGRVHVMFIRILPPGTASFVPLDIT